MTSKTETLDAVTEALNIATEANREQAETIVRLLDELTSRPRRRAGKQNDYAETAYSMYAALSRALTAISHHLSGLESRAELLVVEEICNGVIDEFRPRLDTLHECVPATVRHKIQQRLTGIPQEPTTKPKAHHDLDAIPISEKLLLDCFAANAMQAYLSRGDANGYSIEDHAESAYAVAQAMLAERELLINAE